MNRRLDRYANFFSLLAVSMGWKGKESLALPFGEEEWRLIYDTACRQTVQGLMYDTVEALPKGSGIPRDLAADWYSVMRAIGSDHRRIREAASHLEEIWKANGIRAVMLKGLRVAALYPVPERRVCGDIDWWMPTEDDWNKAVKVLELNGIPYRTDSDGDISFRIGDVVVENHRKGYATDRDASVPGWQPTPEEELLLLSEHILHHAMVAGVGLRQVCDYAVAKQKLDYDAATYGRLLKKRGLTRWTALLDSLIFRLAAEPDSSGQPANEENCCPEAAISAKPGHSGREGAVSEGGYCSAAAISAKPESSGCKEHVSSEQAPSQAYPADLTKKSRRLLELIMSDGNFGLDKPQRFSGFLRRAMLFAGICPGKFISCWTRLVIGRIKRK